MLEISQHLKDIDRVKFLLNNIGDVFLKDENYKEAVLYYKRSLELYRSGVFDKEYKRATKNIAIAYEKIGNFKLALKFNNKYIAQLEKVENTKISLEEENDQFQLTKPPDVKWNKFWVYLLAIITFIMISMLVVYFVHNQRMANASK